MGTSPRVAHPALLLSRSLSLSGRGGGVCVGSAGLKDLLAEVVDVVRLRAGLVWALCCACLMNISLPAEARLGR